MGLGVATKRDSALLTQVSRNSHIRTVSRTWTSLFIAKPGKWLYDTSIFESKNPYVPSLHTLIIKPSQRLLRASLCYINGILNTSHHCHFIRYRTCCPLDPPSQRSISPVRLPFHRSKAPIHLDHLQPPSFPELAYPASSPRA